ncbi:MAG: hypothetical protein KJ025_01620 [Burkholderiales bacterium]|nr:hypothetical protein [Burkholderiales bacterium]
MHDHTREHMDEHESPYEVSNMPHQHALTLVGRDTVFGVHMTQYHCEEHKYQLVLKLELPPEALSAYREQREAFPLDYFCLCNDERDLMTIPDLASGKRASFRANIFQGLPPFGPEDEQDPHFFPWALTRVEPIAGGFEARIARVVFHRAFAHHYELPEFATYLLFGEGGEAHMNNVQTARLASGPFEAAAFGPDYDHAMSLEAAPKWLHPTLLEAGIIVTTPSVRLRDPQTRLPTIPCKQPFPKGGTLDVLYRGIGPARQVTAGASYLFGTAVCNSPSLIPCSNPKEVLQISATPQRYLK